MLLFTAATLALFAGSAVQAATFNVDVGASGNTFSPTTVANATTGDIVVFTFKGGSHTVTQSTFAAPCTALTGGKDSGTATPPTVFNYTVTNADPAWFYCKPHCKGGMVFAINPTTERTYDAFKAAATGGTGTGSGTASSGPSGTPTGSTAPAATTGAASGRAAVGVGAVAAALLFGGINAI